MHFPFGISANKKGQKSGGRLRTIKGMGGPYKGIDRPTGYG